MPAGRMHEDELEIDDTLVADFVATQFPQWAHLPLRRYDSAGTVNAIYRLGEDLAVRLPLQPGKAAQFERDRRWLPLLRPRLPLAIPEPLAAGEPTEAYPSAWAVYRWLPGEPVTTARVEDPLALALDLAGFILALQALDTSDGPPPSVDNYRRGAPLAPRDTSARKGLEALRGVIDTDAATEVWERALAAPEWDGPPTWLHGDLMPGNLLVEAGRLSAVIDFGSLGVGDPACDMIPAWLSLPASVRGDFRAGLGVDDATWQRGRGWALWVCLVGLPYYPESNPAFWRVLRRGIDAVLDDPDR
jgi:aminoglycoside phosphotransferase (APT) family kinase protein